MPAPPHVVEARDLGAILIVVACLAYYALIAWLVKRGDKKEENEQ